MSANGRLTIDGGVLSGRVPDSANALMDAAVVGSTAGIEVQLEHASVTLDAADRSRRAPLVLDLALSPAMMRLLLVTMANALKLPALTDAEWRLVTVALEAHAQLCEDDPTATRDPNVMRDLAARLREALAGVPT